MQKRPYLSIVIIMLFIALASKSGLFYKEDLPMEKPILQTPLRPTPTPLRPLPESKILENDYHVFQSFNNCGPAAFSMALSYYGIQKNQQELGDQLRPYQVPGGDNDDKSVTLEELAEKAKEYNLIPYHRPNGNSDLIKQFIALDIPVITRTWLKEDEDIGHYRVIKGYDSVTQTFIQDDSLQGHNLRYTYAEFNRLWEKFGFEYLVLIPEDKKEIAEAILGEDTDEEKAWEKAVEFAKSQLAENPANIDAQFNVSVAYYKTGDYQKSVEAFEKVESRLPFRTLWYQIEPIEAYYELGQYDRVFAITDKVLQNQNRAFSELYFIRGKIYQNQGNLEAAKQEFDKAVLYNQNFSTKVPQI